ncbi:sodium:pantothenate symporter [Lysinibacillus contaminans]|uniref:Sodium:pantothenate symporter n=1 Tax=Lysinibacillus contaminans TaxID=1293441 RepID=A0ABR5K2D6_9BACI|nr:YhdT family protein [Lysinibacillus contaminans]KOS68504.1 sodium:pantothenate symporter [Lysinibacillus contaminans]
MKDQRFKIAHKEALIGIGLVIINFAIWYGFAYGLGSGDPTEYKYVFGFPAWFFYSCIVGTVFMIVLVWVVMKLFFTDVSFDDEEVDK